MPAEPGTPAPRLLLGPLLRYADETTATVWVETSGPCDVEVLGRRSPTFEVEGHWYGYVVLDGLAPGTRASYDVRLDGVPVWPAAGDPRPAPVLRTTDPDAGLDLVFGSCRTDRPHRRPWTLPSEQHPEGVGADALHALSLACQRGERPLPDLLLMLGDQVYADEGMSPVVRARQRRERGDSEPRDEVRDFEEYTWLYQQSWGEAELRWLLASVPTAMVFDDHDVRDDWNTSAAWRRDVQALPWWPARIEGAYASYWLYQHLGNVPPQVVAADGLLDRVREHGGSPLREMARRADRQVHGDAPSWWSFTRTVGGTRLVVVDTRSGRDLDGERRSMLTDGEWDDVERGLRGDCDHLVVASSVPVLLEQSLHDVERWNEAVCAGRWGRRAAVAGEALRQRLDLEHWSAFSGSFDRLVTRLAEVAEGRHGAAPATVTVLSGDVHHSYVAPLRLPRRALTSRVTQVVSSPLRQAVRRGTRAQLRLAATPPVRWAGRVLARSVGLPRPEAQWGRSTPLLFGNGLGRLRVSGRRAELTLERALPDAGDGAVLVPVHEQVL